MSSDSEVEGEGRGSRGHSQSSKFSSSRAHRRSTTRSHSKAKGHQTSNGHGPASSSHTKHAHYLPPTPPPLPVLTTSSTSSADQKPDTRSHNALHIPYLLSLIFDLLPRSSQARCARVCRVWSHTALSALWCKMDGVLPLLRILGPMKRDGRVYVFSSAINPSSWARFSLYAAFIRHLFIHKKSHHDLVGEAAYAEVARARRRMGLLPNLEELVLGEECGQAWKWIVMLFVFGGENTVVMDHERDREGEGEREMEERARRSSLRRVVLACTLGTEPNAEGNGGSVETTSNFVTQTLAELESCTNHLVNVEIRFKLKPAPPVASSSSQVNLVPTVTTTAPSTGTPISALFTQLEPTLISFLSSQRHLQTILLPHCTLTPNVMKTLSTLPVLESIQLGGADVAALEGNGKDKSPLQRIRRESTPLSLPDAGFDENAEKPIRVPELGRVGSGDGKFFPALQEIHLDVTFEEVISSISGEDASATASTGSVTPTKYTSFPSYVPPPPVPHYSHINTPTNSNLTHLRIKTSVLESGSEFGTMMSLLSVSCRDLVELRVSYSSSVIRPRLGAPSRSNSNPNYNSISRSTSARSAASALHHHHKPIRIGYSHLLPLLSFPHLRIFSLRHPLPLSLRNEEVVELIEGVYGKIRFLNLNPAPVCGILPPRHRSGSGAEGEFGERTGEEEREREEGETPDVRVLTGIASVIARRMRAGKQKTKHCRKHPSRSGASEGEGCEEKEKGKGKEVRDEKIEHESEDEGNWMRYLGLYVDFSSVKKYPIRSSSSRSHTYPQPHLPHSHSQHHHGHKHDDPETLHAHKLKLHKLQTLNLGTSPISFRTPSSRHAHPNTSSSSNAEASDGPEADADAVAILLSWVCARGCEVATCGVSGMAGGGDVGHPHSSTHPSSSSHPAGSGHGANGNGTGIPLALAIERHAIARLDSETRRELERRAGVWSAVVHRLPLLFRAREVGRRM